jgi:hypothetical protein
MTKAYVDCMGHYSRWDVMRLDLRLDPAVPSSERAPMTRKRIEEVADRHAIDPEELADMISELQNLD